MAHLEDQAKYFAFLSPCQDLFRFFFALGLRFSRGRFAMRPRSVFHPASFENLFLYYDSHPS